MGRKLHLPGGVEASLEEPTPTDGRLDQIGGVLNAVAQLLQGVQNQLDILIKLECGYVLRKDLKENLKALDERNRLAQEQLEKQQTMDDVRAELDAGGFAEAEA